MAGERLSQLVELGEISPMKEALNRAIASLFCVTKSQIQPHRCLNGENWRAVLGKIAADPEAADTAVSLQDYPVIDGRDIWLNVRLGISLGSHSSETYVVLSPQQTGHVVRKLPDGIRDEVLAKVRRWYLEEFLPQMKEGLETITRQFEIGDPLLASDHDNRIFDIHGGRSMEDIAYTEMTIVGENLFWAIVEGGTFYERGTDGYETADRVIEGRRERQQRAVNEFLGVMREVPGRF